MPSPEEITWAVEKLRSEYSVPETLRHINNVRKAETILAIAYLENMTITEADARLVLEEISDTDDVPAEPKLSLARRLIDHFKIKDFDELFGRAARRLALWAKYIPMVPTVYCFHTRTKPYDIGFDKGICCADCGRMMS